MLGIESADTTTAGWFSKRVPAISKIIDRMSEEDQGDLDEEVRQLSAEGYPEDVKQRYVSGADSGASPN